MSAGDFARRFGREPETVVRAPGRVNLIGEHTDYSMLPVMPMAIDRTLVIAAARRPGRVLEADSLAFEDRLVLELDRPASDLRGWHRYLAAVVSVLPARPDGLSVLIAGDLPATGGLSSSSALSVGLLETFNRLWDLGIPRSDYPGIAAGAERTFGIEGGMMDQTVISLAREGTAMRIDFRPSAHRFVRLPDDLRIVVGYSGTAAPKEGAAKHAYNTRVVAARAAAAVIARRLGVTPSPTPVLADVAGHPGVTATLDSLPETTDAAGAADLAGIDVDRLVTLTAGRFDPAAPLPQATVARHVLAEAERVDLAEQALATGDLPELGRLLDRSHHSLDVFGVGSERLDTLVAAMRRAGAYGARLTGAGFGGYALAAVPPSAVEAVVEASVSATGGPAFEVRSAGGVG